MQIMLCQNLKIKEIKRNVNLMIAILFEGI